MLTGLNHITLTVSNLEQSLTFYTTTLGFQGQVKWAKGAYLTLGELWLCLALGKPSPSQDYSHIALNIAPSLFATFQQQLLAQNIRQWQKNSSEGDSIYLLDPDGHRLEVHAGNLHSRLESLRKAPYQDLIWL